MPVQDESGAAAAIEAEVGSWPDVRVEPHRFAGIQFNLGRRELGHLHNNRIADLPFPRRVRDELIADGRAEPHHALPDSGWITFRIAGDEDVERAIELFRLSYERARGARRGG